ncbi:MAG: TatD family hydrolase [Prevotella sp.]|nr:TatD family hydrolase [Prevotella sp.]
MNYIDTHIHIDGTEFDEDRQDVISRARDAGVTQMLVPAIDLPSLDTVMSVCRQNPGFAYPMIGLHPEEVRADYVSVLEQMRSRLTPDFIAIGEVGLDYYWSREFEHEQADAFERQVQWSCETGLPLMIHCRKAQNELVAILRRYRNQLPGGVFHCFTGNAIEAAQLLEFDGFALGIGGVLTFKKSLLPQTLASIPLDRIVLETDAPYMAPVPMRGKRNESAYLIYVIQRLAQVYGVSEEEVARVTTATAHRIFKKIV